MIDINDIDINLIKKKLYKISVKLNNISFYNNKDYILLNREYKKLYKINKYYNNLIKYNKELNFAKLLYLDKEFKSLAKEEIFKLNKLIIYYTNKLNKYFLYLNKNNDLNKLNAYLEIHAGTGGNEASLFVLDLFRMYSKYAEYMNWKIKLINVNENYSNGYKEILFKIIGFNVYGNLKFESGGHRVQRIPITESQGRVHTSTCLVAVIPDVPKKDLPIIKNKDIKIDTFRSSGSGGQHVNTTNSAIRLTHIPTGIVVECQQERSQHKNKSRALDVLKARIYNFELYKVKKREYNNKKKLLGTGFRGDRNRTYNFIQNRITDHRINLTIHSLYEILNGKLYLLIEPLLKKFNYENIKMIK